MSDFAWKVGRLGFAKKNTTPDIGCWVWLCWRFWWQVPYPASFTEQDKASAREWAAKNLRSLGCGSCDHHDHEAHG